VIVQDEDAELQRSCSKIGGEHYPAQFPLSPSIVVIYTEFRAHGKCTSIPFLILENKQVLCWYTEMIEKMH
jgi:hypothetical protein